MEEHYVFMSVLTKGGNITAEIRNTDTGTNYKIKLSAKQLADMCNDSN